MTRYTNPVGHTDEDKQPIVDERTGADVGPVEDYPINSAGDLPDAWAAAVNSDEPDRARDRLVRIAFDNGWESSLPDAAREWIDARNASGAADDPKLNNVATGSVLGGIAEGWPLGPTDAERDPADPNEPDNDDPLDIPAANLAAMRSRGQGLGSGSPS
jgi:hypothetical protein